MAISYNRLGPDWDGYGANPMNEKSAEYACEFLNKLPPNILHPELVPEPTGDLTMVWRLNDYHLVVGIDSDRVIAWGGTTPESSAHGSAKFGEEIPEELINLLQFANQIDAASLW